MGFPPFSFPAPMLRLALPTVALTLLTAVAACAPPPSSTSRCWVQLFAGTGFDPRLPHDIVFGPGVWPSLDQLPNARKDWTGAAESLIAGPEGRVFLWPWEDFAGSPVEIGPGRLIADREAEGIFPIRALRLECTR